MSTLDLKDISYRIIKDDITTSLVVEKSVINQFDYTLLGLGEIDRQSRQTASLAAVFDLAGFTHFCDQIDPDLTIPKFMERFLSWIFDALKRQTIKLPLPEGISLWHPLPYSMKFLGDGLLILWDISQVPEVHQHNMLLSLKIICWEYVHEFLPLARTTFNDPPDGLRCGAAMGTVLSVGDDRDFIGSCINLASRIQKLDGISFAFARRGFNPEKYWKDTIDEYYLCRLNVRGLTHTELVYISKLEFDMLPDDKKLLYPPA